MRHSESLRETYADPLPAAGIPPALESSLLQGQPEVPLAHSRFAGGLAPGPIGRIEFSGRRLHVRSNNTALINEVLQHVLLRTVLTRGLDNRDWSASPRRRQSASPCMAQHNIPGASRRNFSSNALSCSSPGIVTVKGIT